MDPQSDPQSDEFKQYSRSSSSIKRSLSSRHHSSSRKFLDTKKTESDPSSLTSHSEEKAKDISIKRLASLNKPETLVLFLGSLSAVASGVIFPIFGVLISNAIKLLYEPPHEQRKHAKKWALLFVFLGVVSLVANTARSYFFSVAGGKLIKRVRSRCFQKVVFMEISWFDEPKNSSGVIGARLSSDASSVRSLVGDAFGLIFQNVATAIAGLIIAFVSNWILSIIILVLVPFTGLNAYLQIKFLQGFSADAKKKYEEASQVANDAVGSIRTVASFCAEEKVMQLYKQKCGGNVKSAVKRGVITGVGFGLSFSLVFCVYAASFYTGAQLVFHNKTTVPDVFRVFFALAMVAVGISKSSSLAPDTSNAKGAAASIFALLDSKSQIDSSDESGIMLASDEVKGEIELRHVSFAYPTRRDIQIFREFCLTIHASKTVALVGESGSGKSTVISLLQRFYDPDSGSITLDGIEIQKLQLKWLRQQMGLVSQEPVLFNDTIRANIAYGKGGDVVTEDEIIAAAKLANAHTFISSLQEGYDTMVGERGIQLSGGQKQRVAIARAIVKNPRILLLDAESEKVVQDALEQVMANSHMTTIIVAHRLSTIKNADVIAVIKGGIVVEKGKHETLIRVKDGAYASLVALHMASL